MRILIKTGLLGTAVCLLLVAACAPLGSEAEPDASAVEERTTVVENNETASEESTETAVAETMKIDLPDLGPAPEIENEVWLNTDEPVTLASQRGKVILLEFWTFG